jgi:hypothetical protein
MRGQPGKKKMIKTPDLGQFTGNVGVKLFPSDPTNVSDVTDLFFATFSLTFCVKKEIFTIFKIMTNMTEIIRF